MCGCDSGWVYDRVSVCVCVTWCVQVQEGACMTQGMHNFITVTCKYNTIHVGVKWWVLCNSIFCGHGTEILHVIVQHHRIMTVSAFCTEINPFNITEL